MGFKAVRIDRVDGDRLVTETVEAEDRPLRPAEVRVDVEFSDVNYKDGLSIAGVFPFIERFPITAGIDLAGTVAETTDPRIGVGTPVSVNGWGLGVKYDGGYAQRAYVRSRWITELPGGVDTFIAAALGSAGLAAAMAVGALRRHDVLPAAGPVLVTGATGGAGSIAVMLLAHLGYRVVAATGKPDAADLLHRFGAAEVIDRAELAEPVSGLLGAERWAGVIDAVGSHTLANALAQTRYGGTVAAFGLAQGIDLPISLAPFITRGVTLTGVDTVYASPDSRDTAWRLLEEAVDRSLLRTSIRTIGLGDAADAARAILAGTHRGRTVIDVNV
ncbi:MAG TPA: acryloyl-CoA reductase [Actinoplanes sp.]|nr:acryloyl-CoA reductase [Actinoplanes sp.]